MRYLPKSPDERLKNARDIGAASIDSLFEVIPRVSPYPRPRSSRQQAESEIVDYSAPPLTKTPLATPASSARAPIVITAGHHRLLASAVSSHKLHALPGRDHPGHAPGHLRIPDHDRPSSPAWTSPRQHVRRSTGAAEARHDGRSRHWPPQAVVATTVHPEYREVLATYAKHQDCLNPRRLRPRDWPHRPRGS